MAVRLDVVCRPCLARVDIGFLVTEGDRATFHREISRDINERVEYQFFHLGQSITVGEQVHETKP